MNTICLAGPISHLTFEETAGWRNYTMETLGYKGFNFLNPVLDTDINHVNKATNKFGNGHDINPKDADMFFVRDMAWVKRSDIILANFTTIPPTLGGGTPYELGVAYAWGKMVIVVGPKENLPLFCLKGASIHFEDLDAALQFIRTLP